MRGDESRWSYSRRSFDPALAGVPEHILGGNEGSEVNAMRAQVGDQLLAESGNTGLILEVLGHDGHPPYVVRWHRSGHIAMVSPGQYARIIDGRGLIFLREVLARDTAAELVIEAFYPADPATTQALEAAHRAEPPRRPTPSGTSETAVT